MVVSKQNNRVSEHVAFSGSGHQRESGTIFYSDVDSDFIDSACSTPPERDLEELVWRRVLNGLCRVAQTKRQPFREKAEAIVKYVQRVVWLADLTEFDVRKRIADILAYIAKKYSRDCWKKVSKEGTPLVSVETRLNHGIEHLRRYLEQDTSEPYLSHTLCNFYIAWWLLNHAEKLQAVAQERQSANEGMSDTTIYTIIADVAEGEISVYSFTDFEMAIHKIEELIAEKEFPDGSELKFLNAISRFRNGKEHWISSDDFLTIQLMSSKLNTRVCERE